MSLQVEKMEKNMAKLTITVSPEELEKMYGAGTFLSDAVNELIPVEYNKALADCELEIVSQPEIDVVEAEPGKGLVFTAEVAVKPEVTLGQYKGIEVAKAEIVVTEEEVEAEMKKEQEKNSRTVTVEDRAAAMGDIVTLDFEGFVDGVAFQGGKGTDHALTLGSGQFIPGFEEQLVGAENGAHVEVKVTFPENYHSKDLAGKEAVFQCDVKKIEVKELPELDDEFAQDVSEFDTLDEYKEDIKKNLTEKKEAEAKTAKENAVVDKAVENAEMDIPQAMIDAELDQEMNQFAQRIQAQGLPFDQYLQFVGGVDALKEQMTPQVVKRIKTRLVLEKIAEAEAIEVADEKVNEEVANMAKMYNMEADKLIEVMTDYERTQMKKDMAVQEAVTLITEAAKEI